MKFLNKSDVWPFLLLLLALAFGVAQLSHLPADMPTHWNWKGEVDAYTPKTTLVFTFPLITAALYLFLSVIPLIDPLRENFERFPRVYYWIKVSMVFFMTLVYVGMLLSARGLPLDVGVLSRLLAGVVIMFLGAVMGKIKKNYFVGIRVPWTLANEEVWDRTHKFGGQLFILAGVVCVVAAFFAKAYLWLMLGALGGALIAVTVYSYVVFQKLKGQRGESFQRV